MILAGAGKALRIAIASILTVFLTHCGLKGDLYLPEPESNITADQSSDANRPETSITEIAEENVTTTEERDKPASKPPAPATNP